MSIDDATRRHFLYSIAVRRPLLSHRHQHFAIFYFAGLENNGIVGSTFLLISDDAAAIQLFHGYSDLRAAASTSGMAETKMAFSATSIWTRNLVARIWPRSI
ncbi:MAG: hypothetical protein ACJ74Z_12350 [Bryobacteraceae bacterium]